MALITQKTEEKPTQSTEPLKITFEIVEPLKRNAELVFAYEKRDEIATYGAVNVAKQFQNWFQEYVLDKLAKECEIIEKRIEQKKWNKVMELQREFKMPYEQAVEAVFGKPLATVTVQKSA